MSGSPAVRAADLQVVGGARPATAPNTLRDASAHIVLVDGRSPLFQKLGVRDRKELQLLRQGSRPGARR